MAAAYEWRGDFDNDALTALHAAAFGHDLDDIDWRGRVNAVSLGWVCARLDGELVGFVNVIWDGGAHAFILDTVVSPWLQRGGIGTALVAAAAENARALGCQWLHVDFEEHLAAFYLRSCGFRPTSAGLIALTPLAAATGPRTAAATASRFPDAPGAGARRRSPAVWMSCR